MINDDYKMTSSATRMDLKVDVSIRTKYNKVFRHSGKPANPNAGIVHTYIPMKISVCYGAASDLDIFKEILLICFFLI